MIKAYKYRIYPNQEQKEMIGKTIGACRFIYNLGLETKIYAWQSLRVNLSAYDLDKQLTDLKKDALWLTEVDSQTLQVVTKNISAAYKNFFSGAGFPAFKKKRNGGSFTCANNTRQVDWVKSTITVPKIHGIRAVLSRKFEGKIKRVTISKTATNKYFASVVVEDAIQIPLTVNPTNAIGIDLGIKDFATFSTGEKIANPKHLGNGLKRLTILQRRASRKRKGSKNKKKANLKVAILHEKINNQRNDFLHKVSSKLIGDNQTDTICLETLAVKNMVKNHKLAQAISDVSWSEFVRQLEYKGQWYGKNIIKINKWFASSKTCSHCGHKYDELNLSERTWVCSDCKTIHDRDINAAINIRNSGMGSPR